MRSMMSRSRSPWAACTRIVGENGAGKSTLGRIVAGALSADGGRMLLDGAPISFRSPREALDHGVAAIAQEPSLVPQLTVAENVMAGRGAASLRVRPAASAAEGLRGLAARRASTFPAARARAGCERPNSRRTEILRALSRDARIIVMDEPTAALSAPETGNCTRSSARSRAAGRRSSSISHFLREVLELADSVTVLRDGKRRPHAPQPTRPRPRCRGNARQAADADVPAQAAVAADAPVALAVRDSAGSRRRRRDVRAARGRDRRGRGARRRRTHRARPCDLRRHARCSRGRRSSPLARRSGRARAAASTRAS